MVGLSIALSFLILDNQLGVYADDNHERDGIYYASVTAFITAFISAYFFDNWVHDRPIAGGIQLIQLSYTIKGFTFAGGFMGGLLAGIIHLKVCHINVLRACNIIAPGLALGQATGRIGCFFSGCCYGKLVQFYGMQFRVPTQILEAFFLALIGFLLLRQIPFKMRFAFYLEFYGIWRFFIEFLRGDDRGVLLGSMLSPSQLFSVGIMVVSITILFKIGRTNDSGRK